MTTVWFNVLDVGQGSGNYIEVVDTPGQPATHTALLDLGSEREREAAGGPSASYIVASLKHMPQPRLDLVLLSHSDSDHINLIMDVLTPFTPYIPKKNEGKGTLHVVKTIYGHERAKYKLRKKKGEDKPKQILDEIEKYMNGGKADPVPPFDSSFDHDPVTTLAEAGPVKFYLLIGNELMPETDTKKRRITAGKGVKRPYKSGESLANTNSVVTIASYAKRQIVVTGDATGITLDACNSRMTPEMRQKYLPDVLMLTMPHHGSETTILNFKAPGLQPQDNIESFAKNIRARTITASADQKSTFKHPSAWLLRFFWPYLAPLPMFKEKDLDDRHFYTVHFVKNDFKREKTVKSKVQEEDWPQTDGWYTVQTNANVYCNMYYDSSNASQRDTVLPPEPGKVKAVPDKVLKPTTPAKAVSWSYGFDDKGAVLVPTPNRKSLRRLRAAMLAGVPARDLPDVPLEDLRPPFGPGAPAGAPTAADDGSRQAVPAGDRAGATVIAPTGRGVVTRPGPDGGPLGIDSRRLGVPARPPGRLRGLQVVR
jgi:beta-lactamase superfamily II metal-dependent hydrolase